MKLTKTFLSCHAITRYNVDAHEASTTASDILITFIMMNEDGKSQLKVEEPRLKSNQLIDLFHL
ncbi:CLUMA_CG000686, isoform A [Clunio marinus]|uniref:CLUMA_CG000686, isoform A n=1 Tax=Clunio marinus TaxID=568069 RepID=A0A1J1HHG6_9DIPT|nr:CLUMA_CG000686, isoform A [Clunio marinus]